MRPSPPRRCSWPPARPRRPPWRRRRRCRRRQSPRRKPTCRRRRCASTSASWRPMAASITIPSCRRMLEQTVERLVAASERPDLHYKVTMLNSQSINAFALPNGQLYATRGLIALANDESELASVLAHEMGHVIARHAAIREEQARLADLEAASSPISSATRKKARWRSPNRNWRWRASRAPRNSRPTPSASASPRGPATTLTARCGS